MTPRLEFLPPAQRAFWDDVAGDLPRDLVLYGGTAIALRFGHRTSVDFDFFTDQAVDTARLSKAAPALADAETLHSAANTWTASWMSNSGPVRVSFFGGLGIGRVGDPTLAADKLWVASPIDLLATKLKALHDRIEPRDYIDIEALLRSGLGLQAGLAAALALFGRGLNPLDTAKAVAWFRDGDLERTLPASTRKYLSDALASIEPDLAPLPLRSRSLASNQPIAAR